MSQAGAVHPGAHEHHGGEPGYIAARRELDPALVTPEPGFGSMTAMLCWGIGLVGVIALVVVALVIGGEQVLRQAMGGYLTGVMYTVGLALGSLGLVMIFQQFNAGWSAAPRRQGENIASLFWVVLVLFAPIAILEVFILKGRLYHWMDAAYVAGDVVYQKKAGYLNPSFWLVRAALYFAIWIALGTRLARLSREQDETGDKWLTARARFVSSFGLLLFALTTAFSGFDWLMSLDYHWFSTMFGVYLFAGNMIAASALIIVILTTLRIRGRLGPTFTEEHQHDLGKILFAFTVFWAYVTLCQYFLIWYANIPEEAAFYNVRKQGPFNILTWVICFGHFAVPFLMLLIRDFKRNAKILRLIAIWMLVMHAIDLVFIVGPIVTPVQDGQLVRPWLNALGIIGPVFLFLGFVVNKLASVPFVPTKDPRLDEVLHHANYV